MWGTWLGCPGFWGQTLRRWMLSIAVAAAVLISGAARADDMGADGDIDLRIRVAILPMVVNSVGEQSYLRSGLSDMLASRLGQNPAVAVVRIEAESQATTDPVRAANIGVENGAHYVVFGSFTQFGQGASLDVQCVEARKIDDGDDAGARRVFIQSGTVGDIIPKLDETAQKIGRFVAGSEPAAAVPPVGTAPAPAPDAREAELADLRRRLEAVEAYLFGNQQDGVSDSEVSPDASQDFGLR